MATLISFLGKQNNGYRETKYQLNEHCFDSKFMGADLTHIIKPEKLLLIGTAGSMWDVLFEHYGSTDERLLHMVEKASKNQVDELFLKEFTPELEQKLGCKVHCMIIEYARDSLAQIDLLKRIANELSENERISLDITHGFRHLPMLALVAARFLKSTKNVHTEHIYYGAFDMRDENNCTPVVDLNGMLTMLDWVDALSAYKQSDNYAVFSSLLDDENAKLLRQAAFFENINQVHQARSPLSKFNQNLNSNKIDNAFISLVKADLIQRIEWAQGSGQYEHQLYLAQRNLATGDYLQASIRANEAWVSKMVKAEKGNQSSYKEREKAQENFTKYAQDCDVIQFEDLKAIRNAMAHGTQAKRKGITEILNDETKLRQKLNQIIQKIEHWSM